MLIGALEAGGTKMVCAVGTEDGKIIDRISFLTGNQEETIQKIIQYFFKWKIEALGIGCFGPVDLNKNSKTYGFIMNTPKKGWSYCNVAGRFAGILKVPVGFDTDVNGAVLGEVTYGAAKGVNSAIYITVGTGIGVGVYINGALLHGLAHPEAGHILISRDRNDKYQGCCRFHTDCAESLASGSAILGRYGIPADKLSNREEVWNMEGYYLGQAITNYILSYSPEKVILWGGVMHQKQLLQIVREQVVKQLNGYITNEMLIDRIDDYIVEPALGDNAGIAGALKLGIDALYK